MPYRLLFGLCGIFGWRWLLGAALGRVCGVRRFGGACRRVPRRSASVPAIERAQNAVCCAETRPAVSNPACCTESRPAARNRPLRGSGRSSCRSSRACPCGARPASATAAAAPDRLSEGWARPFGVRPTPAIAASAAASGAGYSISSNLGFRISA